MKNWMNENKHGVFGFVEMDTFIPQCCFNCQHYDGGEYGDYGVILSRPYCLMGLFYPTHKGSCKRSQQYPPNNNRGRHMTISKRFMRTIVR